MQRNAWQLKTWSFGRSILFAAMAAGAAIFVVQVVGCMSAPAQGRGITQGALTAAEAAVPLTADELILQMSQSAGIIFVGSVISVRPPAQFAGSPEDAAEGTVEVDFRVEQAVRGVQAGSIYTLREWAGLWAAETARYRAGQRLLMLLHGPNAAGFTSPIHGSEGAIPLRGGGSAPGPNEASSTAAAWMVDVRWLQAQTLRQQNRAPVPPNLPLKPGGGKLHSEAEGVSSAHAVSLLVHALPGPWIDDEDSAPSAESLAHILSLCASSQPQLQLQLQEMRR